MTLVGQTPPATPHAPGLRPAPAHGAPPTPDRRERTWLRISAADKMQATYWAEKRGYPSLNEYLAEAVAEQVRRENQDYDLPTLEIARLNELVDQITALSTNVANLEHVVTQGLGALLGLTRGDGAYLTDPADEEPGTHG
ncbi:hypothetical protein [Granulicoccus phenolivorans]|uniref:hypothetical protein n=1 Tax=Granulicoccus phenolivorans TaxID=266854 RepID=UPI000AA913B7|nr:hypothetical protein [Granulicoccus phenolivorans]